MRMINDQRKRDVLTLGEEKKEERSWIIDNLLLICRLIH